MKKKPILCLLCFGIFLCSGAAFVSGSSPSIFIVQEKFDFGEVEEGTVISQSYVVKNKGAVLLEIREVNPG